MGLAEHDDVLEAFSTNGANEPLNVTVLPGRPERRPDDRGFLLQECPWCRNGRMLRRGRGSGTEELRSRERFQLPVPRRSDWHPPMRFDCAAGRHFLLGTKRFSTPWVVQFGGTARLDLGETRET